MTSELLGTVTTPSGVLVIGDMGAFEMWSGDQPSDAPEWLVAEHPKAATAVDWRFEGPDASRAAELYHRQSLTYLYDMPAEAELPARVAEALAGQSLDYDLVREPVKVPHRLRAQRAADAGGADFIIHGMWFVAVGGLPTDREFNVFATPDATQPGRWQSVQLVVGQGQPGQWRKVGVVGVDWARLAFIDADALGSWVHNDSLDGLADVAFWGRDADAARAALGGEPFAEAEHMYGWADLPVAEAEARAHAVIDWKATNDARLAFDFRPHSHHYQVMAKVRLSEPGSGGIEVGGAQMLGFMTSHGDGVFDVHALDDTAGQLLAVDISLNRPAQG